ELHYAHQGHARAHSRGLPALRARHARYRCGCLLPRARRAWPALPARAPHACARPSAALSESADAALASDRTGHGRGSCHNTDLPRTARTIKLITSITRKMRKRTLAILAAMPAKPKKPR